MAPHRLGGLARTKQGGVFSEKAGHARHEKTQAVSPQTSEVISVL
jgi:hypothetical protein